MLIYFCDLFSQKPIPIPDRNYWDESYSYQLHFPPTGKYQSEIELLNEDSFVIEYSKVLKDKVRSIKEENLSKGIKSSYPNLNSKMERLKELLPLWNNVSLDYYHGDDENFKGFLTSLFNFYYYKDVSIKKSFYLSALKFFDKIPYKSNYRAIGFPMKELARNGILYLTGFTDSLHDLRVVDSTAKALFFKEKRSPQEQADFYEYMGDFWRDNEDAPITTMQYYRIASNTAAIYKLESYDAYIQWERLNDKGFWKTYPNAIRGTGFRDIAMEAMNNVDSYTAEEFITHHIVLKAIFFLGTNQIDSVNVYYSMIIERMNTKDSKWFASDLFYLSSLFDVNMEKAYTFSRYNLNEDLIDLIGGAELVRTMDIQVILQSHFKCLMRTNRRGEAHQVNSFIDNLPSLKLSNGHSFVYNLNSARMYYDEKPDSSRILFDYLKRHISQVSKYEQLDLFMVLNRIAEVEGNLNAYKETERKIEEIKGDYSRAYGVYKWSITLADNQSYSTMLLDSISLIKLLKQSSDALAIKNDSLAKAKTLYAHIQENEKRLINSLRLADSTKNAQILNVQTKANHKLQGVIKLLIAIVIVAIILSGLLFFSYRSRNIQKEKARTFEVMQEFSKREVEKSKLEIGTLRTIFFSHSFWSAFGQIPKKLRLAKLNNDEQKTEIALQVSEGLGRIFYEAVRTDGDTSNLLEEVMLCKKYIETMNLAYSKDVQFKLTGLSDIMESIPFPRLILVHFFVNAFEHGKIGNVKDGYIHVEFKSTADEHGYEIVINDNGIGIEKKIESALRGGYRAIEIGLSSFNLTQKRVQCFFNAATDVYSLFTVGYEFKGVTAIIRLIINEEKN